VSSFMPSAMGKKSAVCWLDVCLLSRLLLDNIDNNITKVLRHSLSRERDLHFYSALNLVNSM
jgi:hypothetical protein